MSVASEKNDLAAWNAWLRYRHFGARRARDFTLKQHLQYTLIAAAGRTYNRSLTDTCRWKIEGDDFRNEILHHGRQFIFLLWHNRLPAFLGWATRQAMRSPSFRTDSIVSVSKDGEFLARVIRECGGGEIRGSSSRDASKALRGAVKSVRSGAHLASVGDGPRGPRYRLKPGPVLLAKATGVPIVLFTWACNRTFQLYRAWDQLMFPTPFSTIRVRFDPPVFVPPDADQALITEIRRRLEGRLNELTEWADNNTRVTWPFPRPKQGEILKRRQPGELDARRM